LRLPDHAERFWISLKKRHRGKAAGFCIGALGGWFGAVMGLIIGAMIDTLIAQNRIDRSIIEYLENPGPAAFRERIPGSAAFCALAVLVTEADDAAVIRRITQAARSAFQADEGSEPELESFARTAASLPDRLNPDLLTESLCARRKGNPDDAVVRESMRDALIGLASSPRAKKLAERVADQLCPGMPRQPRAEKNNPYALLGVAPDASLDDVKAAYRRLAVVFHPDAAVGLDEEQRKSAAEAFMRIDEAYRRILERRGEKAKPDAERKR
jgi:DnaJ like chaperone protein